MTAPTVAPPLTATEAAKVYCTTIGYVYKIARRDKWRRVWHHGRLYYHGTDVERSLGQH